MSDTGPGDNRPSVYLDGDVLVVRASALGTCAWELIAQLQGQEPLPWPDRMLRAFKEGHDGEAGVLAKLEKLGWILNPFWAQRECDLTVGSGRLVRCHPDSAGYPATQPTTAHLIEVKRLHDSTCSNIQRHGIKALSDGYKWQISVEMAVSKMPLVLVIENKGLTPDANGKRPACAREGALHFEFITEPPYSFMDIVKRVAMIASEAAGPIITTTGRPCDNPKQYPCRFRHLRPEPEGEVGVAVADDVAAEYDTAAQDLVRYAEIEKRAGEMRTRARDTLIRLAGTNDDLFSDHFDVHLARGDSRRTDWKALCADQEISDETVEKYVSSSPKTPTVSVKER